MGSGILPRVAGAATLAYGVAVTIRPAVLLDPCGFSDASPATRALTRMTGLRDVVSGLAMVTAADRAQMRRAIAIRVGADLSDAAVLGIALRGTPRRTKALAVTLGWATLCAATALAT